MYYSLNTIVTKFPEGRKANDLLIEFINYVHKSAER